MFYLYFPACLNDVPLTLISVFLRFLIGGLWYCQRYITDVIHHKHVEIYDLKLYFTGTYTPSRLWIQFHFLFCQKYSFVYARPIGYLPSPCDHLITCTLLFLSITTSNISYTLCFCWCPILCHPRTFNPLPCCHITCYLGPLKSLSLFHHLPPVWLFPLNKYLRNTTYMKKLLSRGMISSP